MPQIQMMRYICVLVLVCAWSIGYGQVTSTKIAPGNKVSESTRYDSMQNFLGKNVRQYIGQELYLNHIPEARRGFGYTNFLIDYNKSNAQPGNVYKCCSDKSSFSSNPDSLAGKYFKVVDVLKSKFADERSLFDVYNQCYLKLQEKQSNDIVYFEYNRFQLNFHFIVVGFYEKQKKLLLGQQFVFANKLLRDFKNIETGNPVTIKTGDIWKCLDLTVEDNDYALSLVLQNSLGEKTIIEYEWLFDTSSGYHGEYLTTAQADAIKKKIGVNLFDDLLDGKVKIGFTKEMCRISWGEPKNINNTVVPGKTTEQWVYDDGNYLYFENDRLTAIQN